jgi:small subunit ribosomal protein S8
MATNDVLAACLSKINNAEKVSKNEVVVQQSSKMIKNVLEILKSHDYLGEMKYDKDRVGEKIIVELVSNINECGVIKPRFKVKAADIEYFEQRYLPGKGFGLLIISTSQGLLTNEEAKEKNIGGRLIAYCY